MNEQKAWPGKQNPIVKISFKLMKGFDPEGQPIYVKGSVDSSEEREMLQSILEPLHPVPHSITSVTMGEVAIELEDGSAISLRPVFRPSMDRYRDLFLVGEGQYGMPAPLADLLERWRKISQG